MGAAVELASALALTESSRRENTRNGIFMYRCIINWCALGFFDWRSMRSDGEYWCKCKIDEGRRKH